MAELPGGRVRVIAGSVGDVRGPARTFTPMNVLDVRVDAGQTMALNQPEGWTTLVVVLAGSVRINGSDAVGAAQMATLSTAGEGLVLQADAAAKVLVLSGEPINEPVAAYGPFVMNTREELVQAVDDFNSGRFGRLH